MRGAYEILIYIDEDRYPVRKMIQTFKSIRYFLSKGRAPKHFRSWGFPSVSILFKNPSTKRFMNIRMYYKFYPWWTRIYFGVTPSEFLKNRLVSPHTKALLIIQAPIKFGATNQASLIRSARFFASVVYPLYSKQWKSAVAKYPGLLAVHNKTRISEGDFQTVGKRLSKVCPYFQSDFRKLFPKKNWKCFAIRRKGLHNLQHYPDGRIGPSDKNIRFRVLLDNLYDSL